VFLFLRDKFQKMKKEFIKLFAAIILLSVASCNSDKSKQGVPDNAINPDVMNNPATAASGGINRNENVPVFEFTEETHDFGTITQGEKIAYAFRFKNSGKSDLVIRAANGPKTRLHRARKKLLILLSTAKAKKECSTKPLPSLPTQCPIQKCLPLLVK
jgi:uncharacterized lipoprotein YehR (DUF1307 family)